MVIIMSYEEFKEKASTRFFNMIIVAIMYFNYFYIDKENFCFLKGVDDRFSLSIFLASLSVPGKFKEIMNRNEIKLEKINHFVDAGSFSMIGKILENSDKIKLCFENEFYKLLKDSGFIDLINDENGIEIINESLVYYDVNSNNAIDFIYRKLGFDNFACYHDSFIELSDYICSGSIDLKKVSLADNLENKSKILGKYGSYITDENFITNPAVGRDNEIRKLMLGLCMMNKSVMLVGDAGVGKTAIVEGFVYLIQNDLVPRKFKNANIIKINSSSIVAGGRYRGDVEERMRIILEEVKNAANTILFIDEIHTLIGSGTGGESNLDLANILKPYLDRGNIKIIGVTTKNEYDRYISKDPAFRRRFERLDVSEPNIASLKEIILGIIAKLEISYGIKFKFLEGEVKAIVDILIEATNKKYRVYNDKGNNPDLVVSILERVFAYASLDDMKYIKIEYIVSSIMDCDRLYESARKMYVNVLLKRLDNKVNYKVREKVIPFKRK